jgi:hypothetical protein
VGKDLISHLSVKNPVVLAYRELLSMALSERKFAEANRWLAKLKDFPVSENFYRAEQARIVYASGRSSDAYQLAMQSYTTEPSAEIQKMISGFNSRLGLGWRPSLTYQQDNQNRSNITFDQDLEIPFAAQVKGLLYHQRSRFREDAVQPVYETGLGAGVQLGWGDGQSLEALAIQYSISEPSTIDNLLGYSANLKTRWSDTFQTRLEASRGFIGTALAIRNNIRGDNYRISLHYGEQEKWGVRARVRYIDLSDENYRNSAELEGAWAIWTRPFFLGPVYQYSYDDTKRVSDFYYSPQDLRTHRLGAQLTAVFKPKLKFNLRYLPGYSQEHSQSDRFVQSFDTSLAWSITQYISVVPMFTYEENGSYYYNLSSLGFDIRF